MKRKLMLLMPVILLGASSLVAERKGPSIAPRTLRVVNDSPKGIAVRVLSTYGEVDTFKVPAHEEYTYKWHIGRFNVRKIFVRSEDQTQFGTISEDEIIVPTKKRGRVLPGIRLIYRGLGDYEFSTSILRTPRKRGEAPSQVMEEEIIMQEG